MKKINILMSFVLLLSTQAPIFSAYLLHEMAADGDLELIESLVKLGHAVNKQNINHQRYTPLHFACLHGKLEAAKLLVEKCGACIYVKNKQGQKPIDIAMREDHTDIVKYLSKKEQEQAKKLLDSCKSGNVDIFKECMNKMQYKPNDYICGKTIIDFACEFESKKIVQYLAKKSHSPLHSACIRGNIKTVRYLCEALGYTENPKMQGPSIFPSYKPSPLELAFKNGKSKVTEYLFKKFGTEIVDKKNESGLTILHKACMQGNLEMVQLLTKEYGASVNIKSKEGHDATYYAQDKNHTNIVQYLAQLKEKQIKQLFDYCKKGDLAKVRFYIERLKYSHTLKHEDKTLLDLSCENQRQEVAQYLAKQEPFALHEACKQNNLQTVKYLCEILKYSPDLMDKTQSTPTQIAYSYTLINILKYLIEKQNANLDIKDGNGKTILDLLIGGNPELIDYLLETRGKEIVNKKDENGLTLLHKACMQGNLELVQLLIEKYGACVNIKSKEGHDATYYAQDKNHTDIVQHLAQVKKQKLFDYCRKGELEKARFYMKELKYSHSLKWGEKTLLDVSCENQAENVAQYLAKQEPFALHKACKRNNLKTVKYLCETLQYSPDLMDKTQSTPTQIAYTHTHLDILKYFVEEQNANLDVENSCGETLLESIIGGNPEVIEDLLEIKIKKIINKKDRKGQTPLHKACIKGSLETIQLFIEKYGASINAKSNEGYDAMFYAEDQNRTDVAQYLTEVKEKQIHQLAEYCKKGELKRVQTCIEELKYSPELKHEGKTLLDIACENKRNNVARYLAEQTPLPLHAACKRGNLQTVKYLCEILEQSPNCINNSRSTPSHTACEYGNLDVLEYLVDKKNTRLDIKNKSRNTPLNLALKNGNPELVECLLKKIGKEIVNQRDKKGQTLLHRVCTRKKQNLDIIKLLVETYEADVCIRDNKNKMPIDYIKNSTKNKKIIAYLFTAANKYDECQCSICFQRFKDGQKLFATPCCKRLLDDCITQIDKCPFCRKEFTENQKPQVRYFKKLRAAQLYELDCDITKAELEEIGYSEKEIKEFLQMKEEALEMEKEALAKKKEAKKAAKLKAKRKKWKWLIQLLGV